MALELSSPAFAHGARIPKRHTCDGEDLSPPLRWANPPAGTLSFVLLCDDPDAPAGLFRHWAAYDIPGDRRGLEEGAPARAEGFRQAINDFGQPGYGGPCPPKGHGDHHYHLRLLALRVERLSAGPSARCAAIERLAAPEVLAEAQLVALYSR